MKSYQVYTEVQFNPETGNILVYNCEDKFITVTPTDNGYEFYKRLWDVEDHFQSLQGPICMCCEKVEVPEKYSACPECQTEIDGIYRVIDLRQGHFYRDEEGNKVHTWDFEEAIAD